MFDDGPSDGQPIECRGAAPDFIEQHEARGSGVVQDSGDFAHFHEKSRAPPGQIVAGADAREDAVGDGQLRLSSGNEGAHLRHQHNQRGLPEIRGLATHVGPGDEQKLLPPGLEAEVVRNKTLALLPKQLFDHRMAATDDEEFAGGVKFRARIAAIGRQFCE